MTVRIKLLSLFPYFNKAVLIKLSFREGKRDLIPFKWECPVFHVEDRWTLTIPLYTQKKQMLDRCVFYT